MAFYNWVDDDAIANNVQSVLSFSQDEQRKEGFKAGQVASAIRVNSGLRQSNLVACALMDALGITNADLRTTRAVLTNNIIDGLNKGRNAITGDYVPNTQDLYDLGKQNKRWNRLYSKEIYYGIENTSLKNKVNDVESRLDSLEQPVFSQGELVVGAYASSDSFINVFKLGKMVVAYFHVRIQTISDLITTIGTFTTSTYAPREEYFINTYEDYLQSEKIGKLNCVNSFSTLGSVFFRKEGSFIQIMSDVNNQMFDGVLTWFTD